MQKWPQTPPIALTLKSGDEVLKQTSLSILSWQTHSTGGTDLSKILGGNSFQFLSGNRNVVNNLYAGTHNYKKVGDPATYFGNWERQTASTCDSHQGKRYIRVVADDDDFVPKQLKKCTNLSHITVSEFKRYYDF